MTKIKPSLTSYTFQANVYNEKLGTKFGRTANIIVVASNEKEAYENAKEQFNNLIISLNHHHNINANGQIRKVINTFNYNNLKLV